MSEPTPDEAAIRALVKRYTDAIAARDADAWSATWADDATWELFGRSNVGRSNIRASWEAAMAGFTEVAHRETYVTVLVTGDTATGRWAVAEHAVAADGSEFELRGEYADAYVRTTDGWRFARRTLEPNI